MLFWGGVQLYDADALEIGIGSDNAVEATKLEIAKILVEGGKDLRHRGSQDGQWGLSAAVYSGLPSIVQYLTSV